MNSEELTAYEAAVDNCEVLRARLAKYEGADGKALGVVVPEIAASFPRINLNSPEPLDPFVHCCEHAIYLDRERLHKLLEAAPKPADHSEDVRGMVGWIKCSERTPSVAEGDYQYFSVCVQRGHNGKRYVFPAVYLNKYGLYSEHDPEADEDGCLPSTGWYDVKQHYEYDNWFSPLLDAASGDELISWQSLPPAPEESGQ